MNWREKLADWISGGELSRLIHDNDRLMDAANLYNNLWWRAKSGPFHHTEALAKIARNTCCDGCQEAALVAREALK